VLVAAVADWRAAQASPAKLKKAASGDVAPLRLVENPDILAGLSRPGPLRPRLVVGFAAETEGLEMNARAKLARKGCDWLVANDVAAAPVFGAEDNVVTLVTADGLERWPPQSKAAVADRLAARIADTLKDSAPS
jgi:phosphopantothenoylcysteine decarboxylase / phosphopantothenate---cysteine ligase